MNTCRIRYRKGETGLEIVKADTFGHNGDADNSTFTCEGKVVAAMPKAVVVSVELVKPEDE